MSASDDKCVRVQLITKHDGGWNPIGSHVAFVAIPHSKPAPSVVVWNKRIFHRYAGACGRDLQDGDIYRECSAARGREVK